MCVVCFTETNKTFEHRTTHLWIHQLKDKQIFNFWVRGFIIDILSMCHRDFQLTSFYNNEDFYTTMQLSRILRNFQKFYF